MYAYEVWRCYLDVVILVNTKDGSRRHNVISKQFSVFMFWQTVYPFAHYLCVSCFSAAGTKSGNLGQPTVTTRLQSAVHQENSCSMQLPRKSKIACSIFIIKTHNQFCHVTHYIHESVAMTVLISLTAVELIMSATKNTITTYAFVIVYSVQ